MKLDTGFDAIQEQDEVKEVFGEDEDDPNDIDFSKPFQDYTVRVNLKKVMTSFYAAATP